MNNIECERFARASINIIICDIMEVNVIIPNLIFDYNKLPYHGAGYYMYQNPSGSIITLNMDSILALQNDNDIKTVITYGFIHEIMHMCQLISSAYKTNRNYYTMIEDTIDKRAIEYVRQNLDLIQKRLKFTFNDVFLLGIERQLLVPIKDNGEYLYEFDGKMYIIKTIVGALCGKINYNSDYLHNLLILYNLLKVIFVDGRNFCIDLNYGTVEELNILVNLIYLEEFKFAYIKEDVQNYTVIIKLY